MFESLCLCFASSNLGDAAAGFFPVVFLVASHSEEDNLTPEGWFSWWDEIMVLFQHPAMVPCCLHGLCVLQTVDGLLNSEFPWDVCATECKCHKQSQINGRKKVYCRKFNTNVREKFQNCFSIFCAEQAVHTHTHMWNPLRQQLGGTVARELELCIISCPAVASSNPVLYFLHPQVLRFKVSSTGSNGVSERTHFWSVTFMLGTLKVQFSPLLGCWWLFENH